MFPNADQANKLTVFNVGRNKTFVILL
ncbi:MAG: hypothetical protein IPM89_03285 [Candidatus Competibacteraceae bacterium]|nr:MAG: hypothetical protein IPM89_03285 [Candidatus Competibacteraceae bacterium]